MFVNYAHRGASHYAPENTLSAFYMGLQQGANGIETDVRRSRDGVLVLFHDDTLDRVTNGSGAVGDYTWQELSRLIVTGDRRRGMIPDRMVTLEQFLHYFAFHDIQFAIEFKDRHVEAETLALVDRFGARDRCIFTSFQYENLARLRQLDSDAVMGYLVSEVDDTVLGQLKESKIQQVCPKADGITAEKVEYWHSLGLSVRAWGISSLEIMRHACLCGVDGGMTVNFPDQLSAYLKEGR